EPATGGEEASPSQPSGGDPGGGDPAKVPSTRPGGEESAPASMAWLWGLAIASLLSGCMLLFGRRRARPLAMAPEMQFAPEIDLPAQHHAGAQQHEFLASPEFDDAPTG